MIETATLILFLRGWMSNFVPSPIQVEGFGGKTLTFPTSEHYFMFMKAVEFGDEDAMAKLLDPENKDPYVAKQIGREVKYYNDAKWSEVRYQAMLTANLAKYRQNEKLGTLLLETGTKVLAEANPRDDIWGIALGETDLHATNPGMWKGKNLLGLVLMEVRSSIRQERIAAAVATT